MNYHFKSKKEYLEAVRKYWREHSEKVEKIELWNQLVDDVFNHPKSEYSLFVYELIKRVIFTGDTHGRVNNKIQKKIKEIA